MKKTKNIYIILIFIIIVLYSNICYCLGEMNIISDKDVVEAGEEVSFKIEIKDTNVATFTLEIYWDRAKLEYVSGPENSNNLNNRIKYSWINNDGQNSQNITLETFKFKALQNGFASVAVIGELYNSNGENIEINDSNIEIRIGRESEEIDETIIKQSDSIASDNTNLSILRLSEEGISPDFNKDIKEYYFIANTSINDLEITAIPENKNANVTITGNKNLKMGENIIDIKVESEDKTKTSIYKIYLTKTNNVELANANLETLAIKQGTLEPEFSNNMTQYRVEIANDINKIDILAIPERENASVKILGNNEMKIGENKIEVIVLAENGTTAKKYIVNAYRRNKEEEIKNQENMEYQAERLSAILEEKQNEENIINEQAKEKTKSNIIITIITLGIVAVSSIVYIYKFRNK